MLATRNRSCNSHSPSAQFPIECTIKGTKGIHSKWIKSCAVMHLQVQTIFVNKPCLPAAFQDSLQHTGVKVDISGHLWWTNFFFKSRWEKEKRIWKTNCSTWNNCCCFYRTDLSNCIWNLIWLYCNGWLTITVLFPTKPAILIVLTHV